MVEYIEHGSTLSKNDERGRRLVKFNMVSLVLVLETMSLMGLNFCLFSRIVSGFRWDRVVVEIVQRC